MPPIAGVVSILVKDWWFWVSATSLGAIGYFCFLRMGK
jgi:hypothetical protein